MNMCAATAGTPTVVSAGTTITAEMMYDAVTGTASPRIHTATADSTTVSGSDPLARPTMSPADLRPRPVSVITPTIIPATAVVAITGSTSSPASASERPSVRGFGD